MKNATRILPVLLLLSLGLILAGCPKGDKMMHNAPQDDKIVADTGSLMEIKA